MMLQHFRLFPRGVARFFCKQNIKICHNCVSISLQWESWDVFILSTTGNNIYTATPIFFHAHQFAEAGTSIERTQRDISFFWGEAGFNQAEIFEWARSIRYYRLFKLTPRSLFLLRLANGAAVYFKAPRRQRNIFGFKISDEILEVMAIISRHQKENGKVDVTRVQF